MLKGEMASCVVPLPTLSLVVLLSTCRRNPGVEVELRLTGNCSSAPWYVLVQVAHTYGATMFYRSAWVVWFCALIALEKQWFSDGMASEVGRAVRDWRTARVTLSLAVARTGRSLAQHHKVILLSLEIRLKRMGKPKRKSSADKNAEESAGLTGKCAGAK